MIDLADGCGVTAPTPNFPASAPSAQARPAVRGSVLLVDDDVLVARAYERTLVKAGYAVKVSHDPVEAMELSRSDSFDVVVSDIMMPGMTGLELLRVVRERDLDVPIILMTGNPDLKGAMEAIEYGAFRYITKPVDLSNLLNVVARALRLHQLARVRRETLDKQGTEGWHLGDKAGLEARFASALSKLAMVYQPIVSWSDRSVFANEALVRTGEPSLKDPTHLFDAAERLGRLPELGQAIRSHVARTLATTPPGTPVFVNVHPADLQDATLFMPQSPLSPFANRVVLEITERVALDTIADLMPRVAQLRGMGYRIALDDLGAGYAGLNSFAQLEPEVVKVDMSIVRGLEQSATKQKLLASVVSLCRDLEIHLVTEGVETTSERDAVLKLGGDLCQGYLFARPGKPFPVPDFG
ncbi:MAG: EAL domain-containing protein [Bacteroidota bacterium]